MSPSMSLEAAFALLGLDAGATRDDARRAYRARARLLHPDRVEGTSKPEAERLMAQLNEAWQRVDADLRSRGTAPPPRRTAPSPAHEATDTAPRSPRPSPSDPHHRHQERARPAPREPGEQECAHCGWWPAGPIRLRWITGLVLAWSSTPVDATLCRLCADSTYADVQARTLARGWWGLLAPLAVVVAYVRNQAAVHEHQRLVPTPEYRSPDVRTPLEWPTPPRPLASRLAPVTATLAVATVTVIAVAALR
jgi:hypothetical protein